MKAVITGSEGSLAQLVIPQLLEKGFEIIGIDNLSRYGRRPSQYEYTFHDLDLAQTIPEAISHVLHESDYVFHFAALIYGVVGFHKFPADILSNNIESTSQLLKVLKRSKTKLVYLSSSMVYEGALSFPHQESDTDSIPIMKTSYGLSKYVGERLVQAYGEQYKLNYLIWRPFNVFTPFESPEEVGHSHVFSDLIDKIIVQKLKPLPLLGDGEQIRCFTNIYDVAKAIADYSINPLSDRQILNIANPEPVTIKELAQRIVLLGKRNGLLSQDYSLEFSYQPIYSDDVRKRIPSIEKISHLFGWAPTTYLDESIQQYLTFRHL